jgi:hypothetical protein
MRTLDEIKELIAQRVDEVDFIDILGLTTEDLVNAFQNEIEDKLDKFIKVLE